MVDPTAPDATTSSKSLLVDWANQQDHWVRGLVSEMIAARMQRSPNAVTHLVSRALSELKAVFGDTESLGLPPRPLDDGGPRRDEKR
jgi:hypothetical protein